MSSGDLFGRVAPAAMPPDGEKGQQERGAFYTDDRLALAVCSTLVHQCGLGLVGSVFEAGCGGGAFLRAAHFMWPNTPLYGVDLLPACKEPGVIEKRDLFTVEDRFGLTLGNPDFAIAERVVRHCIGISRYVAFILRLSFLESAKRAALFNEHPLRFFQPIAQRMSCTGDGQTDKVGYGLYVWERGFVDRGEILPPLVWRAE